MTISKIFTMLKEAQGTNLKKEILKSHESNEPLKKALKYGLDPFLPFNVVKVPKVESRLEYPLTESMAWEEFFTVADECSSRQVTGNAAIDRVYTCFSSVSENSERWMRKILKKHLAIGASTKTINKVYS